MDIDSLYDYEEEDQDFYEESLGVRKGYPIDHRSIKVNYYFNFTDIFAYRLLQRFD